MKVSSLILTTLAAVVCTVADGFVLRAPVVSTKCLPNLVDSSSGSFRHHQRRNHVMTPRKQDTSLNVLLEVPDNFFALTFPILGIMLSVSKNFGRLRMEERAWEQRVEEARLKRLREDPTLTEIELRRKEAALEWSAYGKPRMDEERAERERSKRRVRVMDRVEEYDEEDDDDRQFRMSDDEVSTFEMEYGVDYDPYYDDPYDEDELPDDSPFNVDRKYGDRIYENGEIFYKDKESGLFYRQGAKPRNLSFFG
jgi:hypothetical protein